MHGIAVSGAARIERRPGRTAKMPNDGGVGIHFQKIAFFLFASLNPFMWDGRVGVLFVEDEFCTHVAASIGVNAPQMPNSFAMFRVFPNCEIDESIVNDGHSNDLIASGPIANKV